MGKNVSKTLILLTLTTIFYFGGHLIIGGTNYGFPRYHVAILPFVCMVTGVLVADIYSSLKENEIDAIAILSGGLIFLCSWVLRDPLYFINLEIKNLFLSMSGVENIIKRGLIVYLPYYGIPLLVSLLLTWHFKTRPISKSIGICLLVSAITTVSTLDVQHIFAPYRTSVQYGAEGKEKVLREVRRCIDFGETVLATPEFTYALHDMAVPHIGYRSWQSRGHFYGFVTEKDPGAIIAGLTVNTLEQLRWLLNRDSKRQLSHRYNFIKIGTYYLWQKKRNHVELPDS